eukprot:962794-Rhodomonas_salina.1
MEKRETRLALDESGSRKKLKNNTDTGKHVGTCVRNKRLSNGIGSDRPDRLVAESQGLRGWRHLELVVSLRFLPLLYQLLLQLPARRFSVTASWF